MIPIGRQCASGLSLLLSSLRFFNTSAAHGCNGRPPLKFAPTFRKVARGTSDGDAADAAVDAPRCPVPAGAPRQIPERSGLPSGVRGTGAARFGLPSGVLGTPRVGCA